MTAGTSGMPHVDALARAAESFVLVWSSTPDDLPEKISASQLRALVTVRRSGVTTVTALARELDALPSSATRLCDRLVAAGFLDRTPSAANRRFHAVSLTPAGERLLDVLDAHRLDALAAVLVGMDAEARNALQHGLAAFAVEAGRARDRRDALAPEPEPEPEVGPGGDAHPGDGVPVRPISPRTGGNPRAHLA